MAGLLLLVLALAGVGRGLAMADTGPPVGVAGVAAPLCHAGAGGASPRPAAHNCCDACILAAAAMPAFPPSIGRRAPSRRLAAIVAADGRPRGARPRPPRQSRGPPAA